ncbi:ParB/RepB/Spo0J family partition protein [Sphingopyxis sp. DBS4]|uniref:ParB/RepB/Spo0J family partition protein n=1 Tax=Sphingopyxis sp. DBS4 TaxID=2968500 RepID=UPI00214BB264|nr:ParB/RepB/Spo0J family partition protein [Sphingopyxis sp. DBS4]
MTSKNKSFVADLAAGMEPAATSPVERQSRLGVGVLGSRTNRLADLASGAVVDIPQELVDPARCRIWERHNRDYAALNEERCADLIETIVAQGKQEFPAIVRRVTGDPDHDYEVISGARRHWTVSWLRANNYPDIRYLIEIRSLTDEQAFRVSDLENRAREDLTDVERARDYLKALDFYYSGKQKAMAQRLNQSEAWLSRYLDLARLPNELMIAFPDPFELKISHVGTLKPILKPDDSRARVLAEASRLARARAEGETNVPVTVPDILRALVAAAASEPRRNAASKAPPKKTGSPEGVFLSGAGVLLLRVEKKDRKGISVTLFPKSGGSRAEAETAMQKLLDQHWPK